MDALESVRVEEIEIAFADSNLSMLVSVPGEDWSATIAAMKL